MKVLHIAPHVGGGVGTVVSNMLRHFKTYSADSHYLICLDKLRSESLHFLTDSNIEYIDDASSKQTILLELLESADVVILHWWNHPLIASFVDVISNRCKLRLVIWCHISGLNEPNIIPTQYIDLSDIFVFTSPLSYGSPNLKSLAQEQKSKLTWIWSTRGTEYIPLPSKASDNPNAVSLLYLGNLDYAKLSDSFFRILNAVCCNGVHAHIIGPQTDGFLRDLSRSSASDFITYHGFVTEQIKFELLHSADVFVYPLSKHHYGTCDQTLQEAMACGVVPVVFNNPMEKYMVDHGLTGFVADSEFEFIKLIKLLMKNQSIRGRMSRECKAFAKTIYSLDSLCESWDKVLKKAMHIPKKYKSLMFDNSLGINMNLFLLTVPSIASKILNLLEPDADNTADDISALRNYFEQVNQKSPSKSSFHQFLRYSSEDPSLQKLASLINLSNTRQ